jgi:SAM-dependent methyltransferase
MHWPTPIPDAFWGPETLNSTAFVELVEWIDARAEVAAILRALEEATSVVDVGGGTGFLTQQIATRAQVTVIEPSAEQRAHVPAGITVVEARAEALPLPTDFADAALATWVLQYCDDPVRAIDELARVARRCVVIVQAAPMNDLVDIYNLEAGLAGLPPAHHGWLLAQAESRLRHAGFAVTIEHVPIPVHVPDARRAADVLSRLHFANHPKRSEMLEVATARIANRVVLADDGALLVARRP